MDVYEYSHKGRKARSPLPTVSSPRDLHREYAFSVIVHFRTYIRFGSMDYRLRKRTRLTPIVTPRAITSVAGRPLLAVDRLSFHQTHGAGSKRCTRVLAQTKVAFQCQVPGWDEACVLNHMHIAARCRCLEPFMAGGSVNLAADVLGSAFRVFTGSFAGDTDSLGPLISDSVGLVPPA